MRIYQHHDHDDAVLRREICARIKHQVQRCDDDTIAAMVTMIVTEKSKIYGGDEDSKIHDGDEDAPILQCLEHRPVETEEMVGPKPAPKEGALDARR